MDIAPFETLAALRIAIGYLGEQGQHGWWSSSFFSSGSSAFLTPVFPRSPNLARYTGVTQAASHVHDERIGVGRVYHLFRLPEDLELNLHRVAQDNLLWQSLAPYIRSKEAALAYLHGSTNSMADPAVGPIRVGDVQNVRRSSAWSILAALYANGFESGLHVFPYFSDIAS
ncbi:MAG: BrxE family protein [Chloroflexota bacterium]|nr:BrxE family protein [Chloroflexota bacterium]